MILAGEGAAKHAADNGLPFPFVLQETAETSEDPGVGWGLAGALALRRRQLPSRPSASKGRHAGLGLDAYSRVTSPLRRYLDLVAHQQLRLHLRGERTLSEAEIVERMGAAESAALSVRRAERMSRRHWTLAWLVQRSEEWKGEAVIVDHRGSRAVAVIPDLALEIDLQGGGGLDLNEVVQVRLASVDLPRLDARFDLAGRGGSG